MTKNDIIAYCMKNQNNINTNILSGMLEDFSKEAISGGTASADDIWTGKTAYSNGELVTGTLNLEPYAALPFAKSYDIKSGKTAYVSGGSSGKPIPVVGQLSIPLPRESVQYVSEDDVQEGLYFIVNEGTSEQPNLVEKVGKKVITE